MKTQLKIILALASFVALSSSFVIAEDKAPETPAPAVTESSKPGLVQAVDKAHETAEHAHDHAHEMSKEAAPITDDEGMAEEDMEMPEEDMDDAPADGEAE